MRGRKESKQLLKFCPIWRFVGLPDLLICTKVFCWGGGGGGEKKKGKKILKKFFPKIFF